MALATSTPDRAAGARGSDHDQTLFATPLAQVGRLRCAPRHPRFEDPGATETNCFVFPRAALWIEQDGRAPFVADPNSVTFHNAGRAFRRKPIHAVGARSDWFALAPDVLREMMAHYDTRAADSPVLFRFGRAAATADIYLAQRRLYRYVRDHGAPDDLFVEEAVIHLASSILDAAYAAGQPHDLAPAVSRHRRLAERTREYLAHSYTSGEGLATVAREVGSSAFHLCRLFKQQTGFTIHQYRTHLRLRRSLELLEDQPRDILAAAIRLGFTGHSHYTRTFQKAFGVTPSRVNARDDARTPPAADTFLRDDSPR